VLGELDPGPLRSLWTQASTLRVLRREPTWTERGKLMPLHLERRLGGQAGGPPRPGVEA
jgi:hypothetical protein